MLYNAFQNHWKRYNPILQWLPKGEADYSSWRIWIVTVYFSVFQFDYFKIIYNTMKATKLFLLYIVAYLYFYFIFCFGYILEHKLYCFFLLICIQGLRLLQKGGCNGGWGSGRGVEQRWEEVITAWTMYRVGIGGGVWSQGGWWWGRALLRMVGVCVNL